MALKKQSLLSQRDLVQSPRLSPAQDGGTKRVRMAPSAGAELLPVGCPIAYNSSSNLWVPYTQPSNSAIFVLTANATPATAGVMQIVVDGLSVEVVFDVTAVAAAAALNAMFLAAGKAYTVVGVDTVATDLGDANHVATFTFSENAGAPSWDVLLSGVTGNAPAETTTDAGTALNGTNEIRGFVLEANSADTDANGNEGVLLDATDDVLALVLHMGQAYRDDVNTAAMRTILALFGAPSEAELDAALRDPGLRDRGLVIRGLIQVP